MPDLSKPIAVGRTAELFDWDEQTVLKLFRPEFPHSEADFEASIARQVHAAGIRSPAVGDVIEIEGRKGILYERIQGVSLLDEMARHPRRLLELSRLLADLQAEMHSQPIPAPPSLKGSLEYALNHAPALSPELKDAALRRLQTLPDGDRLCHGDFHPANVMLTPKGPVIIDWVTARIGDSWADLARTCLLFTTSDIPRETPGRPLLLLARKLCWLTFLQRYRSIHPDRSNQMQAWLPVMAAARLSEHIPPEEQSLLRLSQKLLK